MMFVGVTNAYMLLTGSPCGEWVEPIYILLLPLGGIIVSPCSGRNR